MIFSSFLFLSMVRASRFCPDWPPSKPLCSVLETFPLSRYLSFNEAKIYKKESEIKDFFELDGLVSERDDGEDTESHCFCGFSVTFPSAWWMGD